MLPGTYTPAPMSPMRDVPIDAGLVHQVLLYSPQTRPNSPRSRKATESMFPGVHMEVLGQEPGLSPSYPQQLLFVVLKKPEKSGNVQDLSAVRARSAIGRAWL